MLREKYPNTELFLVRTFLYSVRIQEILIRNNSLFGRFSRSAMMHHYSKLQLLMLPYLILHCLILRFLMRHHLILNYFKIVLFDIPLFLCWTIYCGTISKLYYLMFHYFHVVLFNVAQVDAALFRFGQIARPIPIGRARRRKPLRSARFFWRSHFAF